MPDFFDRMAIAKTHEAFDDFWAEWPDKKNKESARKAFMKLHPREREKAIERAATWAAQWRKDNPQASHIHASTYLNQKRFLDLDEIKEVQKVIHSDAMLMQARWIKEGKDFLARNISRDMLAAMVSQGIVTPDEVRRVGL